MTPQPRRAEHSSYQHLPLAHPELVCRFALTQAVLASSVVGGGDAHRGPGRSPHRGHNMPIRPYLAGRTFVPETVSLMNAAFAEACQTLNINADDPSRA